MLDKRVPPIIGRINGDPAPRHGTNPVIPQYDDGIRIEPPRSVPSPIGAMSAAIAAPV